MLMTNRNSMNPSQSSLTIDSGLITMSAFEIIALKISQNREFIEAYFEILNLKSNITLSNNVGRILTR